MSDTKVVTKKPRKPRTKKADKEETPAQNEQVPKKRGRKPKGGKIVKKNVNIQSDSVDNSIIILHLKCKLSELDSKMDINCDVKYKPEVIREVEAYSNDEEKNYYSLTSSTNNDVVYNVVEEAVINPENDKDELKAYKQKQRDKKVIYNKLKELEKQFNINNVTKKSACFWCTCDFNSAPIYIPSLFYKDRYDVYGCFCSPECATSYLFKENIDNNTKFERYQLLNYLYGKVYDYKKEIKQAPNPYYTLNKFYGNLTIQEYRQLLEFDRLILVIDKPVTKIFPEVHEDNNEFETLYENKVALKKTVKADKNDVINNVFSIKQS